jgi:hypothetical protein
MKIIVIVRRCVGYWLVARRLVVHGRVSSAATAPPPPVRLVGASTICTSARTAGSSVCWVIRPPAANAASEQYQ